MSATTARRTTHDPPQCRSKLEQPLASPKTPFLGKDGVHLAAIEAFDADDGLQDGVIQSSRYVHWDTVGGIGTPTDDGVISIRVRSGS